MIAEGVNGIDGVDGVDGGLKQRPNMLGCWTWR